MWVSAAVHGDEVNGVEIIRRVLKRLDPTRLAGHVVAVPVVNVFGFIEQTRELPDRRDLNRSFPGSARGSLAARLAHLFMKEIVSTGEVGIDLHTGSNNRKNLPQIRADLADPRTRRLAQAFGAPVTLPSDLRKGSLREACARQGQPCLLYEGGEALRYEEDVIEVGVRGVLKVMRELGMRGRPKSQEKGLTKSSKPTFEATTSRWIRAPRSGTFVLQAGLGERIERGEPIGLLTDPMGQYESLIPAPESGVVIGVKLNPVVYRGDALVHLATS